MRRYQDLARKQGYLGLSRPLPESAEVLAQLSPALAPPSSDISSVEPYREVVETLLTQGVETMAIHQRLVRHHGYRGSYHSVLRFVHQLRPRHKEAVVRLEWPPGQCVPVEWE